MKAQSSKISVKTNNTAQQPKITKQIPNQQIQTANMQTSATMMQSLPPELMTTFEKLISQLDLVSKTMKIMDQRIQNIENEVGAMYNRQKKGLFKMEASYNEEDSENKKDLMDTMKYYKENFEKKNVFNENLCSKTEEAPVEIFEDVSNHVEDLDEEKH